MRAQNKNGRFRKVRADRGHARKVTYEEWKISLIECIINEPLMKARNWSKLKLDEIRCVINDDCDYPQLYKDCEEPCDVWQGEIDAIRDSQ